MLIENKRFQPFPELQTDRLTLRELRPNDSHQIFQLRTLAEVNRYLGRPHCQNLEEAASFIHKINGGIKEGKWVYWGLSFHTLDSLIGTICLWNFSEDFNRAEIGVEMHPSYQGKGLMTESLLAVIDYAIQILDIEILEGFVHEDNLASCALMEKVGFQLSGSKMENDEKTNKEVKMLMYRLNCR